MPTEAEIAHIHPSLRALAVDVSTLTLDPQNARKHNSRNLEALEESLKKFGMRAPIVVQRQGDKLIVRAGNGRTMVAQNLGWKYLPAVIFEESDSEAMAFAIADNRTAELAEWDFDVLEDQLEVLVNDGYEMDDVGFDETEMFELFDNESVKVQYTPLDEIQRWPRNPKDHDLDMIKASLRRHGYVDPIVRDATSGRIVAGHGREEALSQMHAAGEPAPKRVKVLEDGRWAVPVLGGVSWKSEQEAEAFLVASNRLVELGGWDAEKLTDIFTDLRDLDVSFDGMGYSDAQIRAMLTETKVKPKAGPKPEDKLENFLAGEVKQIVLYFDSQEYQEVVEKLEAISEEAGLETHTEAVIHVLEAYKPAGG